MTLFTFFCKLVVKLKATFSFSVASMDASSFPATDVGLTSDKAYERIGMSPSSMYDIE